jgi:poly(A) polymerase
VPPEQLRPALLVTGHDLIAAGCKPGPAFGAALREAEDAQLEGRVATKEAALPIAIEAFRNPTRPQRPASRDREGAVGLTG